MPLHSFHVGAFFMSMTEFYDDLEWDIDETPIGSSTPDELYELSYRATANCSNGHTIDGIANYWSRDSDMSGAWLNSIDYTLCEECENEEEQEDEDDDDF